jgi:glycerol-3-phosphate acyltransferase PlsX
MGGDHGLAVTLAACGAFARAFPDDHLLLVGRTDEISAALPPELKGHSCVTLHEAAEVVAMDDALEVALRRKKNSSMRVALELVKHGDADAAISAGNTAALMAISRFVLKTLDGIDRPAIATALPNAQGGATTVLDLGANVDCSPQHLLQFGLMGAALVGALEQKNRPSVGLLNIGEEIIKGNDVVKQAAELLRDSGLNFHGNVEGDDIFKGTTDIVVCDGFVGNVALKTAEGLAQMLAGFLKQEFSRSWYARLSAVLAYFVLARFKRRVDHRRYNGAALLGLKGIVIKSHGSADAYAFEFALRRARDAVRRKLIDGVTEQLRVYEVTHELPHVASSQVSHA